MSCVSLGKISVNLCSNPKYENRIDLPSNAGYNLKSRKSFYNLNKHKFIKTYYNSQVRKETIGMSIVASVDADPIKQWILTSGKATKILKVSPVGGGCINVANKYDTDVGSFFVKSNRGTGPKMFEAEAKGLEAMHDTNTIRVPKPFKVGTLAGGGSFIIMEYIEIGSLRNGQAELGRQLALMHKAGTSAKGFGFDVDNTIGSTPQKNPWSSDWISFFRDHRLGFQFELARQQYRDVDLYEKGQQLLKKLPEIMGNIEYKPSLIHGDLWSGNVASDKEGNPVILDPATYYGHNEAEFGMSWCASFGPAFYKAYFEVLPKEPGFDKRAPLYQLYHYLNHYNLFGSGYRSSCTSIMSSYL